MGTKFETGAQVSHFAKDGVLYFERAPGSENTMTISAGASGVGISVAEEKAVDSYNDTFTCTYVLDAEEARALKHLLAQAFPD